MEGLGKSGTARWWPGEGGCESRARDWKRRARHPLFMSLEPWEARQVAGGVSGVDTAGGAESSMATREEEDY